jgi:hypothetical protein
MQTHVKVLGILHIVFGGLGILAALVIMAVFGSIAGLVGVSADRDAAVAAPIIGVIGSLIMVLIVVLSVPGIIIGWGILNFRPWARIWGIVLSAFELIQVPLGTLMGIYGLWVLLSNEGTALFSGRPLPPPPAAWQPPPPQQWGQQNPPGPRNPT